MEERCRPDETYRQLPLVGATAPGWALLAAADLGTFLADHAVCEQQAALTALNLIAHYPEDAELVERMAALAAEEVAHLRRVTGLMRRRGLALMRRRTNAYVRHLRGRMQTSSEPLLKTERLLVGALIEARSCERFTRLLEVVRGSDDELARLLADLGPAERRHWEMFHALAAREADADWLDDHWRGWLEYEAQLNARGGTTPRVHG